MKKLHWQGIIGAFLAIVFLISAVNNYTHSEDAVLLKNAVLITNLLWASLGVFIFANYIKNKQAEDAGLVATPAEPNSPEDIESLNKRRKKIFGYLLLLSAIGSVNMWILNDYTAGLTLINLEVIFDVLFNILFLFIVIQLFRNKNVLGLLFWASIVYLLEIGIIEVLRGEWTGTVCQAFLTGYYIFAIKAPLNRKNYRIAHFVLLPMAFILTFIATSIDGTKIDTMWKNEGKFDQEYSNANASAAQKYFSVIEKEEPEALEIEDVQTLMAKRDEKVKKVIASLEDIQSEYKTQINSEIQQRTLKNIKKLLSIYKLDQVQGEKIQEFMMYYSKLDFKNLTPEQKVKIHTYVTDIDAINDEISQISLDTK